MDFLTMQQELATRLSAFDETISDDATKLQRWLNMAQDDIASRWDWDYLQDLDIIQTTEDITTGTVAINNAATALTFSSAPAASVDERFIQIDGADDWYRISAHTAASTSATIDPSYIGSTVTAATYTVREYFYSLDSTVDRITAVMQAITPIKMRGLSYLNYWRRFPFSDATGPAVAYFLYKQDSSNNWQIGFYPFPDDQINVWVKFQKKPVDLSSSTGTSLIPKKFHHVMLDMASYYGFHVLDDTRADSFMRRAEQGIDRMKASASPDADRLRIMTSIDEKMVSGLQHPVLPPEFGPMSHG